MCAVTLWMVWGGGGFTVGGGEPVAARGLKKHEDGDFAGSPVDLVLSLQGAQVQCLVG